MGVTDDAISHLAGSEDILAMISRSMEEAERTIGRFNILIAGRTGVGKSTLINEVFQGKLAATGQGRPVTRETHKYTRKGVPLAIYDTRGVELKDYRKIIDELADYVADKNRDADAKKHIHVAWVCVSEDGRRVEEGEIELHRRLAEYMPVVGVVTKARSDQGFGAEVQRLLPEAVNVVRVRALREGFDDSDVILPPMGLDHLVEATAEIIPEAAQKAFAAAQKASVDLKKKAAHRVVIGAATAAAAAGASPIPFSDAALLVPIQIGMLAAISASFGVELSKAFFRTLVAAMAGTTGATFAGRAIVSNLLKFIPGVGSVAGGVISATTAGGLTTALGELYIVVLAKLSDDAGGGTLSPDDIADEFKRSLTRREQR